MADTVVEMFYNMSGFLGYPTDSSLYVATASVEETYVPLGLKLFNEVTLQAKTIVYTGSDASTSGDILDDRIITTAAAYFADMDFDNFQYDPETGELTNRHYDNFLDLLKMRYGIYTKNGTIITPKLMKTKKASKGYVTIENKS